MYSTPSAAMSGVQPMPLTASSLAPRSMRNLAIGDRARSIDGAVQRRFAVPVRVVHPAAADLEHQLDGFERFFFGARALARRPDPDASRHHQRRRAVFGGELRVGAVGQQQPHQRQIDVLGRQQERRRANPIEHGCDSRPSVLSSSRLLTSAPRSSSFLTRSRLSRLPVGTGPGRLKPVVGRRLHTIWCSGVQPCAFEFGSAPRSSRKPAISQCEFQSASTMRAGPFGSASLTSAPASSRTRAASICPPRTANRKAVKPPALRLGAGRRRRRRSSALRRRGVVSRRRPHERGLTLPPVLRVRIGAVGEDNARTAATVPLRAAVMIAGSPSGSEVFASAPAASSRSMIAALPLTQARYKRRHAVPGGGLRIGARHGAAGRPFRRSSRWTATCSGVVPSGSGAVDVGRLGHERAHRSRSRPA